MNYINLPEGEDYSIESTVVFFIPYIFSGSTSCASVTIFDDEIFEEDETFNVTIDSTSIDEIDLALDVLSITITDDESMHIE